MNEKMLHDILIKKADEQVNNHQTLQEMWTHGRLFLNRKSLNRAKAIKKSRKSYVKGVESTWKERDKAATILRKGKRQRDKLSRKNRIANTYNLHKKTHFGKQGRTSAPAGGTPSGSPQPIIPRNAPAGQTADVAKDTVSPSTIDKIKALSTTQKVGGGLAIGGTGMYGVNKFVDEAANPFVGVIVNRVIDKSGNHTILSEAPAGEWLKGQYNKVKQFVRPQQPQVVPPRMKANIPLKATPGVAYPNSPVGVSNPVSKLPPKATPGLIPKPAKATPGLIPKPAKVTPGLIPKSGNPIGNQPQGFWDKMAKAGKGATEKLKGAYHGVATGLNVSANKLPDKSLKSIQKLSAPGQKVASQAGNITTKIASKIPGKTLMRKGGVLGATALLGRSLWKGRKNKKALKNLRRATGMA